VSIRDKVEIKRGGDIYHQRNKIGRISQSFLEKIQGESWEVSSVIRYKVTEKYNEGLHPKIKQKGWLYTVLVRSA